MEELGAKTKLYAIDIETAGQGVRANDYTDTKRYRLGNVKDPAKIEAKLKEKREEARTKHALNWWTGKIISIAVVDVYGEEGHVFNGHDEQDLLEKFTAVVAGPCKLIGKNSKTFDFPYLVGRLMAHDMPVPKVLRDRNKLFDVEEFFGWSSASGQRGALADYSHGLNMSGKLMDGASVPKLYEDILIADIDGDNAKACSIWKEIGEYNLDDTHKVAEMARRYYR